MAELTREELLQKLRSGEISYIQFENAVSGGPVPQPGEKPPSNLYPYIPTSDPYAAQIELVQSREQAKRLAGEPAPEAFRQAMESVEPIALEKATTEYGRSPAGGVGPSTASLIRDAEKGIIYDPELRTYRKGTTGEMLWESFFPQIIAEGDDFEPMAAYIDEGLPEGASFKEQAIQKAAYALMTPSYETGQVVESPLGAGLRALGTFPAVAAASVQPLLGTEETDTYRLADSGNWSDQVIVNIANLQGMPQLFESTPMLQEGNKAYQESKLQEPVGLSAAVGASPQFGVAKAVWSYLGEDLPWWAGLATEFYMPVTGAIAVPRRAAQAASYTGRQAAAGIPRLGVKGVPKVGEGIAAASNPVRYAKYKQAEKVVDEILETAETGASAKELRKIADSAPWSSPERWQRHLDGSSLKAAASENIGRHISDVVLMDEMVKVGALTDDFIKSRPSSMVSRKLLNRPANLPGYIDRSAYYRSVLRRPREAIDAAAETNTVMGRLVNQAEVGAEMAIAMTKGEKIPGITYPKGGAWVPIEAAVMGTKVTATRGAGRLGMQIQDNLFRIRMARHMEKFPLTGSLELSRAISKIAKTQDKVFDLANFPELGVATLDDIAEATTKAVSENAKTSLLNMLPENLTVISGSVVAPRKALAAGTEGKKAGATENVLKWQEAIKSRMEGITMDAQTGLHQISDFKDDIAEIIVREVGAATIRRSKDMQKTLANILKGEITSDEVAFVQKHLKGHFAKKYLDAFDLRYGGEQIKRAIVPDELAYGATQLAHGPQKGHLSLSVGDIVSSVRVIADNKIPWLGITPRQFLTTFEDVDVPPEIFAFQRRVNDELASVMPRFMDDLKEAAKRNPSDPSKGFDEVSLGTWDDTAKRLVQETDNYVASSMNGSWSDYARLILEPRQIDQLKRIVKPILKSAKKEGKLTPELENQVLRDVILDFKLFNDKADAWNRILSAYYGGSAIENIKESLHNIMLTGLVRKSDVSKGFVTQSRASNVFDLSVGNLQTIIGKIDGKFPTLKGKGLKTLLTGKKVYLPAMMDWIVGYRKANRFNKLFDDFLDANPQYTSDFAPTPNSMYAQLDISVLTKSYEKIYDTFARKTGAPFYKDVTKTWRQKQKVFETLRGSLLAKLNLDPITLLTKSESELIQLTKSIKSTKDYQAISKEFKALKKELVELSKTKDLPAKMAEAHIEAVQKTTSKLRRELIGMINTKIVDGKNTGPDLGSIVLKMREKAELPMQDLSRALEQFLTTQKQFKALKKKKQIKLQKNLQSRLATLYFGPSGRQLTMFDAPVISAVNDALFNVQQAYKAHGIAFSDNLVNATHRGYVAPVFRKGTSRLMTLTSKEAFEMKKLFELSNTTRLNGTLDKLRAWDEGGWKWVGSIIGSLLTAGRRNQTSALLGGFPFPNSRYHGQNIFTAPVIAATTLGLRRTALAAKEIPRSISLSGGANWLRESKIGQTMIDTFTLFSRKDSDVLFTSDLGRKWTVGEVKRTLARTNTGFTRGDVEFSEAIASEGLRGAKLAIDGKEMGNVRYAADLLVPWKKNIWQHFADGTDNVSRRAVFISALREGKTVEEAARLAQRSMLDYGAMTQVEQKHFGHILLFWAFRRQMMAETVNSVYRATVKGEGPGVVINQTRLAMRQQQQQETWFYSTDEGKKRLYTMFKGRIDNMDYARFGPANPSVEIFETGINTATLMFSTMKGEEQNTILDLISSLRLTPAIQFIAKILTPREGTRPPKVPPQWVYLTKALGVYDSYSSLFNYRNDVHRKYAGSPSFGEADEQPRFGTNKDAKWFAFQQLIFIYLGVSRNISEYPKWAMTAGVEPPGGADLKRQEAPHAWLYPLTLDTALPLSSIQKQGAMKRKAIEKRLEAIMSEEDIYKE